MCVWQSFFILIHFSSRLRSCFLLGLVHLIHREQSVTEPKSRVHCEASYLLVEKNVITILRINNQCMEAFFMRIVEKENNYRRIKEGLGIYVNAGEVE